MVTSVRSLGLALALLVAALLACGGEGEDKLEVCETQTNFECKDPKQSFSAGVKELHAVYVGKRVGDSNEAKVKWYAEKTAGKPPHSLLTESKTTLSGSGDRAQLAGRLTVPSGGWPQGEYRVEIWFGDKPASSTSFKVE